MSIKEDIEKVQKKVNVIEEQSFALDLLRDYKKQNKRQFIVILVILSMWFITIGYLVYVLNDIGTVETTTTQEVSQDNSNGTNNFIGNNGDVINGKAESEAN